MTYGPVWSLYEPIWAPYVSYRPCRFSAKRREAWPEAATHLAWRGEAGRGWKDELQGEPLINIHLI